MQPDVPAAVGCLAVKTNIRCIFQLMGRCSRENDAIVSLRHAMFPDQRRVEWDIADVVKEDYKATQ